MVDVQKVLTLSFFLLRGEWILVWVKLSTVLFIPLEVVSNPRGMLLRRAGLSAVLGLVLGFV